MKPVTHNSAGRWKLLEAVRAAVESAGGRLVDLREFLLFSGMREDELFQYFSTWEEALRAAGFVPCDKRLGLKRLLADWGRVARKLGRLPSREEYDGRGKFGSMELVRRLGSWGTILGAFRAFAKDGTRWKDVLAMFPPAGLGTAAAGGEEGAAQRTGPGRRRPAARLGGRPVCGGQLGIGCMRNAPVNEQGVLFLFAIVAERLGFQIEAVQAGFPDCEAKRLVGEGRWQTVRIEFEYESRNFQLHKHAAEGCDIIVCWVHNWAECPEGIEVIALREEVEKC